jgi:bifunctional non-homologous end joining protein LigD
VLDDNGYPDFSALQNYQGSGDIVYYIFDLLYFDGEDLMNRPLLQRKELLLNAITKENILTYSDHFPDGIALFEKMKEFGLEGLSPRGKTALTSLVPVQRTG